MFETGTWVDFQSPTCQEVGGTNADFDGRGAAPCGKGILRGDWGESWSLARGQEVSDVIGGRIVNTIILMTTVSVLSLVVAIPIGVISAVRQYSKLDYAVTTFSFFGIAMPSFWFGLLLIIFFGLQFKEWGLPFFPTGDVFTTRVTPGSIQALLNIEPRSLADRIIHLVLPTAMLTLLYLAGWSRFMRSQMLEVLRQDYVRTARAKGLRERVVVMKHATRNALIPLITIVVFQIPDIFSGAIITETIFNYPGMGRLFIDALNRDDWPIVMAFLFITAILVVIATLLGDILYTIVDPRIRFE
jgi:peptide/nickel transport system permease protein